MYQKRLVTFLPTIKKKEADMELQRPTFMLFQIVFIAVSSDTSKI